MPPKHQGTKNHKRLNIIKIALVEFSVMELWWQVFYFLEWTQGLKVKLNKQLFEPQYAQLVSLRRDSTHKKKHIDLIQCEISMCPCVSMW
jgi:hypothetical protein